MLHLVASRSKGSVSYREVTDCIFEMNVFQTLTQKNQHEYRLSNLHSLYYKGNSLIPLGESTIK